MIRRLGRIGAWLGGGLLVLVILGLTLLRVQPDWVLGLVNVFAPVQIETRSLALTLVPLRLVGEGVEVTGDGFVSRTDNLVAEVDWAALWNDTPFWSLQIEGTGVRRMSVAQSGAAGAGPSTLNLPAILLQFTRILIDELRIEGQGDVRLDARRVDDRIELRYAYDSDGVGHTGEGNLTPQEGRLALVLTHSVSAPDLTLTADLRGDLANAPAGEQGAGDAQALNLRLQDSHLHAVQGVRAMRLSGFGGEVDYTAATNRLTLQLDGTLDIDLDGADAHSGDPLSLVGTVRNLTDEPTVEATINLGESSAVVTTEVSQATQKVELRLESDALPDYVPLAGFHPSQLFPLQLDAQLLLRQDSLALQALDLTSPGHKWQAEGTYGYHPLRVQARIDAQLISAPALGEAPVAADDPAQTEATLDGEMESDVEDDVKGKQASNPETAEAPLFAATPIDWRWLQDLQVEVDVQAETLRIQDAEFSDFALSVKGADDGRGVVIDTFEGTLGDGGFSGSAALTLAQALNLADTGASSDEPAPAAEAMSEGRVKEGESVAEGEGVRQAATGLEETAAGDRAGEMVSAGDENEAPTVDATLRFALDGVRLEQFGFVPTDELSGGAVRVNADLTARGASAAQLAGSTAGDVLFLLRDARLANDFIEIIGSDFFMQMLNKLNPFHREDPSTQIECAVVHLRAADGVLKNEGDIALETTKMDIIGAGQVQLLSEEVDLTFTPSAREGLGVNVGSLVKFVKLGGTLRHPTPEVDALGLLQSGAAVGAALSTGGVSILAEGLAKRALNAGSACSKYETAPAAPEDDAPAPVS
ncbi:MAG: hypothetical protein AAF513_15110 [Pseudomonadota bacterium]